MAFLSRFSSKAAWRIKQELARLDRIPSDLDVLFKDLFQTALEAALDPAEFFKNFDPEQVLKPFWYPALQQYVNRKMTGMLCDKIRAIEGMATYKRTTLGLLARSSEKRVAEALKLAGETKPQLSRYVLAWQCFQEARSAKQFDLEAPQTQQFAAIASRYQRYRSKLSAIDRGDLPMSAATMEMWLKKIGGAIRNYLDRPLESLEARFLLSEEETSSRLERLVDTSTASPGETLLEAEIKAEAAAFKEFLDRTLATLDRQSQCLPLLLHGLRLAQTQVGVELDKDQSYVSRHYQKLLNRLGQQIGPWAAAQYRIELGSEILSSMRDSLREQLDRYYGELVDRFWQQAIDEFDWQPSTITPHRRISTTQEPEKLARIEERVAAQIADWLDRPLKPQGVARRQLALLMAEKLKLVGDRTAV